MKDLRIVSAINDICNNIDIDFQIEYIKKYAEIGDSEIYGGKHCGSDAEHKGADYISKKLEEIGVPEIEKVEVPTTRYQFNDAEITVITDVDEKMEIRPYGFVSPGTTKEGITAELVDVDVSAKEFYDKNDIEGKIVLMQGMGVFTGGNLSAQMEEAIMHGAKAIIGFMTEEVLDEDTIRVQPPNINVKIPMVSISMKHAAYLKRLLKENETVEINLRVDADYVPNGGKTYNVVGKIPGTISDEQIIFSAHLDHYFRCIQDNMASCAALLGIAKAIIDSGYKPKRSIVFAFHGSHELGMVDSRYAYISGSYKLVNHAKPEWKGKTIATINFEYAGLPLDELRVITSVGNASCLNGYFEYAPELVGGFKTLRKSVITSEYYLLSWGDVISYNTAGIPVYSNDIITEQMATGNSPYAGRDHSNKDNWDSFDKKALEDTIRFYGCFGIYLDNTPYMDLDFRTQATRMREETDIEFIKSLGIEASKLDAAIDDLLPKAEKLYGHLNQLNKTYINKLDDGADEEVQTAIYKKARHINASVLALFDLFQSKLEKIGPPDFLYIGNQKYSENIKTMVEAINLIKNGKPGKALEECLKIDICPISYYFSREVAEHISAQISSDAYSDKRTWARGKELSCLTLYDLIQSLKERKDETEGDFSNEIGILEAAIDSEKALLKEIIKEEKECLIQAANEITKLVEEIEKQRS